MDDSGIFQQISNSWQAMAATLSASVASAWAMIKTHSKRLERIDNKVDALEESKATREELRTALERMANTNNRIYQRIDDLYLLLLSKADDRISETINNGKRGEK